MKRFNRLAGLLSIAVSSVAFSAEPPIDFAKQIKPILADRCVECHNSETLFGELNLQTRDLMMRPRKAGPVIVAKEPEKSMLYVVLTLPPKEAKAMPATGHRIAKSEMELIRQWIAEGADWPSGKDGAIQPRKGAGKPGV